MADVKAKSPRAAVYLDAAGAALPSQELLERAQAALGRCLWGNPHSTGHPSSIASHTAVEALRADLLRYLGTSPSTHEVIFTSSATGALRLLADSYTAPTLEVGQRVFFLLDRNHTSVVGMRNVLAEKAFSCISVAAEDCGARGSGNSRGEDDDDGSRGQDTALFAFPAQCNYSGQRFPLEWVAQARAGRLLRDEKGQMRAARVILDAASFLSSACLDLSQVPADYVVLSFYKLFGLPTGLGALVVRKPAGQLLQPRFFGGGSVKAYSGTHNVAVRPESTSQRLEFGTLPFLEIVTALEALKVASERSLVAEFDRVLTLAKEAHRRLHSLRHRNGTALVEFHCAHDPPNFGTEHGPIVTFVLRRPDGSYVSPVEVQTLAATVNLHLRAGCMCNAGACHFYAKLCPDDLQALLDRGYHCGTADDLDDRGRPVGGVRASFGLHNTAADVEALCHFVEAMYLNPQEMNPSLASANSPSAPVEVTKLSLFPVKSCGAFEPTTWTCTASGLAFDRHFMVVDDHGRALTQKQHPRLATVLPVLSVDLNTLTLRAHSAEQPLVVPLHPDMDLPTDGLAPCRVCAEDLMALDCGAVAAAWFTSLLGVASRLVRQCGPTTRPCNRPGSRVAANAPEGASVAFANEAPLLLVTQASMDALETAAGVALCMDAFRANIVVAGPGLAPWAEDTWSSLVLGAEQDAERRLQVMGPCARCRMVCVDQVTGELRAEPLRTLSRIRRRKGQTFFGVLAAPSDGSSRCSFTLNVGDRFEPR